MAVGAFKKRDMLFEINQQVQTADLLGIGFQITELVSSKWDSKTRMRK